MHQINLTEKLVQGKGRENVANSVTNLSSPLSRGPR